MYKLLYDVKYDVHSESHEDLKKYQKQFLYVFGLKKFTFKLMEPIMVELYDKIKDDDKIKEIIILIKEQLPYIGSDEMVAFQLFFSYQSFFYFHKCLQDKIRDSKSFEGKNWTNFRKSLNYFCKK